MLFKSSLVYKTLFTRRSYASNSQADKIAFVGVGLMGVQMVKNLLINSQASIKLLDTTPRLDAVKLELSKANFNLENLSQRVAQAQDVNDLKDCNVVITMLPNSNIIENLMFEQSNCLSKVMNKNALYIDSSTISPNKAKYINKRLNELGVVSVDAPVSGGVIGAERGTLSFMVGTDDDNVFKRVESVVSNMGKTAYKCGGSGYGQIAKLCNNMLLGITMIGVSEALCMGGKMGFDPKLLNQIINTSTGRCWSSETNCPVPNVLEMNIPSNNGYKGGFNIKLIEKDLNLASELSKDANVPLLMGAQALNVYRMLGGIKEYEKLDFGAVYKYLNDLKK